MPRLHEVAARVPAATAGLAGEEEMDRATATMVEDYVEMDVEIDVGAETETVTETAVAAAAVVGAEVQAEAEIETGTGIEAEAGAEAGTMPPSGQTAALRRQWDWAWLAAAAVVAQDEAWAGRASRWPAMRAVGVSPRHSMSNSKQQPGGRREQRSEQHRQDDVPVAVPCLLQRWRQCLRWAP